MSFAITKEIELEIQWIYSCIEMRSDLQLSKGFCPVEGDFRELAVFLKQI
jgi:hypothetical protein